VQTCALPISIADDGYAGFIPRHNASDEPAIPAFAKSEAELREEFQRRFGNVIPGGTDNKPQQQQTKPASGSRFAEMVAQYGGQQPNGTQTESGPQEEKTPDEDDDEYASDDDEIIEDSGLAGRSVVESLLNARLVEERNAAGTPKLSSTLKQQGTHVSDGAVPALIDELGRRPGIGPKSAQRIASHIMEAPENDMMALADALTAVKAKIRLC